MSVSFSVDPIVFLDEHAHRMVSAYFNGGPGEKPFSGRRFERLAGGGDHPDRRDWFDASDLVAVSTLSVDIPAEAAIWILEDGADDLTGFLSQIPADVTLAGAPETLIDDDSPATALWKALEARDGVGWVTAGKLCARKRPHLLPVYDSIVKGALHSPEHFWQSLHGWVREDGHVERLSEVRDEAGVGDDISLLRILDVAIWMRCRGMESVRSLDDVSPAY